MATNLLSQAPREPDQCPLARSGFFGSRAIRALMANLPD
jgi:hypothetical protein